MFKALKISSEVMVTIAVIILFLLAWVTMEYGPRLIVVGLVALAVYLVYRKENKATKVCKCDLCKYVGTYGWPYYTVTKTETQWVYLEQQLEPEDPRIIEHRKFLADMDNYEAKQ